jgi:hypothetical protein
MGQRQARIASDGNPLAPTERGYKSGYSLNSEFYVIGRSAEI